MVMSNCFYVVSPVKPELCPPESSLEYTCCHALASVLAQSRGSYFILRKEQDQGENAMAEYLSRTKPADRLILLTRDEQERLLCALRSAGRLIVELPQDITFEDQVAWLEERLQGAEMESTGFSPPYSDRALEGVGSDQMMLLSSILEQMAEGVVVADPHGKFKFFNRQAEHLLGDRPNVSPDQWSRYFQTQRMDESGNLRPVSPHEVPMVRALAGEKIDNEEYFLGRGRGRKGAWISVNSRPLRNGSGEMMGAVSVCRDVTDLKGAEQEARRAHQDFRRVIEASRDGVGIHREGRWVYANSALLSALGYAEMSELLAIPLLDLVPEENAVEARDWLWAPIEGKLPPVREFDFLRRDGSRVSMEVCPALLTEFEGDEAVLVVFRDISQRKQLEGQLILSERMASLGTVASGVGHEINNPLSIIVMNLELALQELQTSSLQNFEKSRTNEMLAEALEAAQRINRIVGDLRVLSSREKSSPSALDLEAVLDSAVGVLLNELRFRAVLTKRYSGNLPRVLAVGPRLAQVALNLLLNAMQSIPEGEAELNSIVLATEMEGDSVRFSVSDTGSGIKPEVAREMFTPFFTTKPVGLGTGLGLSLCYKIVTDMGGTITYQSTAGRGSTFIVTLPSIPVPKIAPPASVRPADPLPGRVLVVDDEPGVCKMLERSLGREHSVEVCEDGLAALLNIQGGSRYDVILCDIMMPRMTGLQLYEALAVEAPEQAARVIFLTGGVFTERAKKFLAQTARPVLSKPCELEELRAEVRSVVAEARKAV